MYKVIVLAPSTGGKSSLVRYLREHTNLNIAEMDEEILRTNRNVWPIDLSYKDGVLVPKITKEMLGLTEIIYFASYFPTKLVPLARENGFRVLLLQLDLATLHQRNKQRMKVENYDDTSRWFEMQLNSFEQLQKIGLIEKVIVANKPVSEVAKEIVSFTE